MHRDGLPYVVPAAEPTQTRTLVLENPAEPFGDTAPPRELGRPLRS